MSYICVVVSLQVTEDEAVHILATKYCVLLMHGTPFGAPNHMRLSYGSIPPSAVLGAIDKIRRGFAHLQDLSDQRLVVV